MTEQMKIEELLNSYIDGELSVRQRTEVKRMVSNDPKVAVRLRELQKCKTLVSALPVAQAPSHIMENIKASLNKEKTPVQISGYRQEKTGISMSRRIFAAAAMVSVAAVLVFVFNIFMSPEITQDTANTFAAAKFNGKLELKTDDLNGMQSVISKAIAKIGFESSAIPVKESNKRIYTLSCSREGLDRVLFDLERNWDKVSSAQLLVDTGEFGESIDVASVTPSQFSAIVNQKDKDQTIKVAKDISVINKVNEILSDNGISASSGTANIGFIRPVQPVLVSENKLPVQQDNGEKTIQLKIILSK